MTVDTDNTLLEQSAWFSAWRKAPWWARLLGMRRDYYRDNDRSYRLSWGEATFRLTGPAFRIGAFEAAHLQLGLGFASVFVRLPFLDKVLTRGSCSIDNPSFGFSTDATALHLNWSRGCKIIWWPWTTTSLYGDFLAEDGRWLPTDQRERSWRPGEGVKPYAEVHPYHYMLDNGEVQHVEATVTRTRAGRGLRWFSERGPISRFLRSIGPKSHHQYIDIEFSGEVGARAGSWKGGCTGCAYEMKPGETPRHTLSRMQRERRFR